MGRRAQERVRLRLQEAEARGECYVPDRADRAVLARLVEAEAHGKRTVFEPIPGIFADAQAWRRLNPAQRSMRKMRAIARVHPNWTFCGPSAALLYGLPVSWKWLDKVHVATNSSIGGRFSRDVARHRTVDERHRPVLGLDATSPLQTLFDCAAKLDFPDALAVADAFARRARFSPELLSHILAKKFRGRRGIARVLAVLALADERAESGGESVARAHMLLRGFPAPELQAEVRDPLDPGHVFRPDFAWRGADGEPLFAELDGGGKYIADARAEGRDELAAAIGKLREERLRESRITLLRAPIARFCYEDIESGEMARVLAAMGVPQGPRPRCVDGVPMTSQVRRGGWSSCQARLLDMSRLPESSLADIRVEFLCTPRAA